ncbi:MAG: PAS domain S-box protein [Chloroflexota bacterium]
MEEPILQFIGISGEIDSSTQQLKDTLQELGQNKDRFERVLETIPAGVITIEKPDGRVSFANKEAVRLYGADPTNLIFEKFTKKLRLTKPDGSPYPPEELPMSRALKHGEVVCNVEVVIEHPDCGRINILASAAPSLSNDGEPVAAVGVLRDVTELKSAEEALKKSEERFLKAFHHSPVAMSLASLPDGKWVEVNDSFLNLMGYSRDEVIGHTPSELGMFPNTNEPAGIMQLLLKRGRVQNHESTVQTKTGNFINVHSSIEMISIRGQDHLLTITIDITERKKAEKESAEYRDKLEVRVRERTAEIGRVTERLMALSRRLIQIQEEERTNVARELHDQIGQSLNIVKILLDRASKTNGKDCQELIGQARPQLAELIDQVGTLSLDLRPKILDDLGLVEALEWYFGHFTTRTNVRVQFEPSDIDKSLDAQITNTVYRVVQEALTNVARHAHATIVRVKLQVRQSAIDLCMEDNGIGFDLGALLPLTSGGITGMQERINLVGGTLKIQSKPGAGTRIIVKIPTKVVGKKRQDDNHSSSR